MKRENLTKRRRKRDESKRLSKAFGGGNTSIGRNVYDERL
jgi:hypothetical protein